MGVKMYRSCEKVVKGVKRKTLYNQSSKDVIQRIITRVRNNMNYKNTQNCQYTKIHDDIIIQYSQETPLMRSTVT